PGPPAAAVLSHSLWQERFSGDPMIVGSRIVVNGLPATVVGVAARGFNGADLDLERQLWLPISLTPRAVPEAPGLLESRDARWITVLGRLRPGGTSGRGDAALAVVAARRQAEDPRRHEAVTARTSPAGAGLPPGALRSALPVAGGGFAVTGVVLLIACANVSSLLLGRAVARRREMGIRLSLGASRGRIVRQLLTESVLLAGAASAAGLVLAAWGVDALARVAVLPPVDARPNPAVLAFCAGAALLTGVLFGAVPALDATRADVGEALKDGPAGPDPRRARLQGRFVTAQVALSLVLLAVTGFFLRSLSAATGAAVGYDASDRGLAVSCDRGKQGSSEAGARAFTDELRARAEALPGVRAVAFTTSVPMARERTSTLV